MEGVLTSTGESGPASRIFSQKLLPGKGRIAFTSSDYDNNLVGQANSVRQRGEWYVSGTEKGLGIFWEAQVDTAMQSQCRKEDCVELRRVVVVPEA